MLKQGRGPGCVTTLRVAPSHPDANQHGPTQALPKPVAKAAKTRSRVDLRPPSDRVNHARRMVQYQPRAVGARAPQAVLPDLCDSSDSASAFGKLMAGGYWRAT